MKAEHRKELGTNVLADRMGRMVTNVRRRPRGRAVLWWVLGIIAVIVLIIVFLWRRTSALTGSDLWVQLDMGNTKVIGEELLKEDYRYTPQGKVARFQMAYVNLWNEGILKIQSSGGQIFLDPDSAKYAFQRIQLAQQVYRQLMKDCKDDPLFGPEAAYSIGIAYEALGVSHPANVEKAKKVFEIMTKPDKYSAEDLKANKEFEVFADAKFESNSVYVKKARDRLKIYNDEKKLEELLQTYTHMNPLGHLKALQERAGKNFPKK